MEIYAGLRGLDDRFQIAIPDDFDESVRVELGSHGVALGMVHGHKLRGGAGGWYAKQCANFHSPVAGVEVFITGHLHNPTEGMVGTARTGRPTWWQQAGSLDGGSSWFEQVNGQATAAPSALYFEVSESEGYNPQSRRIITAPWDRITAPGVGQGGAVQVGVVHVPGGRERTGPSGEDRPLPRGFRRHPTERARAALLTRSCGGFRSTKSPLHMPRDSPETGLRIAPVAPNGESRRQQEANTTGDNEDHSRRRPRRTAHLTSTDNCIRSFTNKERTHATERPPTRSTRRHTRERSERPYMRCRARPRCRDRSDCR